MAPDSSNRRQQTDGSSKKRGSGVKGVWDGFRRYPLHRDGGMEPKSLVMWLKSKRTDDGADGLWRIHGKLYDFTEFVGKHPGGKDWLNITKGTDITEAFEASHLSKAPETLLSKYYKRDASTPRNSPFTFNKEGFYMTLKKRVGDVLKNAEPGPSTASKRLQDAFLAAFVISAVSSAWFGSYILAIVAGIFLTFNMNSSHNFLHQRDNWRMYLCDLTFQSHWDFRVTHALSHHMFPNTVWDWEMAIVEPHLMFQTVLKGWVKKFAPIVLVHLGPVPMVYTYLMKLVGMARGTYPRRWYHLLVFVELAVMISLCKTAFLGFQLWALFHLTYCYLFIMIGLTAAHHHPDIYHTGDEHRKDMDWGLHQYDAVRDRKETNTSFFLVAVSFGHHFLHHLFPTVDHSKLPLLYPVLHRTCKEFGVNFKVYTIWELFTGCFRQLARTTPNAAPRDVHKRG